VQQAEHRGVRANPECEYQDGHGSEEGSLAEPTKRVPNVAQQRVKQPTAAQLSAHVKAPFMLLLDANWSERNVLSGRNLQLRGVWTHQPLVLTTRGPAGSVRFVNIAQRAPELSSISKVLS
jgi:hypothetical protein